MEQSNLIPSKSKLIILRAAAGLNAGGRGEPFRNHIIVPNDHPNPLLETAQALEKDGAVFEDPGDFDSIQGTNRIYFLTGKGIEMARPKQSPEKRLAALERTSNHVTREVAVERLVDAQTALVDARGLIEQLPHEDRLQSAQFLAVMTMFLASLGEAAYQLRHPEEASKHRRIHPGG